MLLNWQITFVITLTGVTTLHVSNYIVLDYYRLHNTLLHVTSFSLVETFVRKHILVLNPADLHSTFLPGLAPGIFQKKSTWQAFEAISY